MKAHKVDSGAVAQSEQASGELQNTAPLSTLRRPFDLSAILSRTSAEVNAVRRAVPKGSEPSRLQMKAAKVKDETKDEARWKKAVWKRDGGTCRWCGRVCRKCLDLAPDRGEVHHVSGRVVRAIRWDRRNGLLLCATDHERITGRVAEKALIYSRHTFTVEDVKYINADKPVKFKVIA